MMMRWVRAKRSLIELLLIIRLFSLKAPLKDPITHVELSGNVINRTLTHGQNLE